MYILELRLIDLRIFASVSQACCMQLKMHNPPQHIDHWSLPKSANTRSNHHKSTRWQVKVSQRRPRLIRKMTPLWSCDTHTQGTSHNDSHHQFQYPSSLRVSSTSHKVTHSAEHRYLLCVTWSRCCPTSCMWACYVLQAYQWNKVLKPICHFVYPLRPISDT